MRQFTAALLGAGRMGQIHLTNAQGLDRVFLKYVYDPAMLTFSNNFGTQHVTDIDVILKDKSVDVCIIATPSTFHADLITACARAGKHVFCEKPVSFNVEVLQAVKKVVGDAGITVQIGFNRRFDKSYIQLRREIESHKYGAIHVIKIVNRDPKRPRLDFVKNSGGLFFDFNIHDFDMLRFISGADVREVYAVGSALVDPELQNFDDIDTCIITARLSSGALAIIDSSRETGYGYDQQLEVLAERGMLRVDNQSPTQVAFRTRHGLLHEPIFETFTERYRESYSTELASFFAALESKLNVPSIDDAIAAVRIAKASMTSLQENRPVTVLE